MANFKRLIEVDMGFLTFDNERTQYFYEDYGDYYNPFEFERILYTPIKGTTIYIDSFLFQSKAFFTLDSAIEHRIKKIDRSLANSFIGFIINKTEINSLINIKLIFLDEYEQSILLTNKQHVIN